MELSTAAGLASAGPGNSAGGRKKEKKEKPKDVQEVPLFQEHTPEPLPGQFWKTEGAGFWVQN